MNNHDDIHIVFAVSNNKNTRSEMRNLVENCYKQSVSHLFFDYDTRKNPY